MVKEKKSNKHSAITFSSASTLITAAANATSVGYRSIRSLALLVAISSVSLSTVLLMASRVSGDDTNIEKYAIRRVQPDYPPLAQQQRIEGIVIVQVTVGGDGKVTKAEFVRGNNIFRATVLDAAKRWVFKPPSATGIEGTIRFVFKLDQ